MDRGPYFMDGSGPFGQGHDDDIGDFNNDMVRDNDRGTVVT
jgi:hypothetical protein